jgi:hypothetical protein
MNCLCFVGAMAYHFDLVLCVIIPVKEFPYVVLKHLNLTFERYELLPLSRDDDSNTYVSGNVISC